MDPTASPAGAPPALVPLHLIGTGVLLVAPDADAFAVRDANARAMELLSMAPAAVGGPVSRALPEAARAPLLEALRACGDGGARTFDVRVAGPGPARVLRFVLEPQLDGRRALEQVVVTVGDAPAADVALGPIEASEVRFRNLVEGSIQGVLVVRGDQALFCNSAFLEIGGFDDAAEVCQRSHISGLVHEDDRVSVLETIGNVGSGRSAPQRVAYRAWRKDGRQIWIEILASRVQWDDGPAVLLTISDVTEQVEAQAALRDSEERYRALVEVSLQGILVSRDGEPVFVNHASARMAGYDSADAFLADAKGRRFPVTAPEDRDRVATLVGDLQSGALDGAQVDLAIQRRDGTRAQAQAQARRITWEGEPAVMVTLIDITERKQLEAELRESRALLQTVFDALPIWVVVKDREGNFLMGNRSMMEGVGISPEMMDGLTTDNAPWLEGELRDQVRESDRRVIETGECVDNPDAISRLADGTVRRMHSVRVPVYAADGTIAGLVTTLQDVTAEREAEAALRQSQALLQSVFDAIPVWITVKDPRSRYIMANRAFAEAVEFPLDRLGEFSNDDVYWHPPEVRDALAAWDARVMQTRRQSEVAETWTDQPVADKDRDRECWHIIKAPVIGADDELVGMVSISIDITERMVAQEALSRSERLLRSLVSNAPVILWAVDKQGTMTVSEGKALGGQGFQPGEAVGRSFFDVYADYPDLLADVRQALDGTPTQSIRETLGRMYDRRMEPVRDESGAVTGVIGVSVDVTERARAEQALAASEARYRTLVENSLATITVHQGGKPVLVNDTYAHLLGYPDAAACLEALQGEALPHVAPEFREEALRRSDDMEQGRTDDYSWERPTVRLDGERRDLFVRSCRIEWDGTPAVLSTALDITERKRAEATLRASEERYRALVESSVQGICVFSLEDHRALFVNGAMLALTGVDSEADYLGSVRLLDNIREPHLGTLRERMARMAAGELDRIEDEIMAVRSDETPYWVQYIARRVQWESEPAVQITLMDITDRKRAEEALKDRDALLSKQNEYFRQDLSRRRGRQDQAIVAESPGMRRVLHEAEMVARSRVPVLIEGATGTGKEVVAEFIHRHSDRAANLLSVVNCGALSETLMDAELFGHERGAFTGATEARAGLIEIADGGTLFLDEIGDLPPSAQVRLLRVLERGVVRRVGSTRERKVDVRILAATHKTLKHQVQEGTFREDLYHRLLVIRIEVPALRQRIEDILPLARRFCAQACQEARVEPLEFGEAARLALTRYEWPGNVRELAHTVQRAVFAAQLEGVTELRPEHLDLPHGSEDEILLPVKEVTRRAEQQHVRAVLRHFGGNRRQAAEVLGISERHLYRLLG